MVFGISSDSCGQKMSLLKLLNVRNNEMSLALQTAEMEKVLCIRFAEIVGYASLIN